MFIRVYDCYDNEWAVINTDRIEKIHPYGDDKKQHIVVMTSESVVVDEATVQWIVDELNVKGKMSNEKAMRESIQQDKVSFRCGDCANFGGDCGAGDVDGNEDCIACEKFRRRVRMDLCQGEEGRRTE